MSDSDTELLERMRHGDEAAFEELFLRHYAQVYRVLYQLLADRQAAEDLVQETFLTLFRQPPPPQAAGPLPAWLCRVALNRGYNVLRSDRRERARLPHLVEPDTSLDPQVESQRREDRRRVRATLAALPERQRSLLLLRYAELSYAEIATVLDVAPGSIGTLLARAERAFMRAYERAALAEHDQ
jgi:RNA polymerase sigma-70 factor, ECF subfamily